MGKLHATMKVREDPCSRFWEWECGLDGEHGIVAIHRGVEDSESLAWVAAERAARIEAAGWQRREADLESQ